MNTNRIRSQDSALFQGKQVFRKEGRKGRKRRWTGLDGFALLFSIKLAWKDCGKWGERGWGEMGWDGM